MIFMYHYINLINININLNTYINAKYINNNRSP